VLRVSVQSTELSKMESAGGMRGGFLDFWQALK